MEIESEFRIVEWADSGNECRNSKHLYTCYVEAHLVIKPETKIKAFTGKHVDGKSDQHVQALWIQGLKKEVKVLKFKNIKATGTPEPGVRTIDVGPMSIQRLKVNRDSDMDYVPRGIKIFFPDLVVLSLKSCNLKYITRKDLVNFKRLESIHLGFNQLTSIPSNLFNNMPKLTRIALNNNKIEFLSSRLLKPVINNGLSMVELSENASIDAIFNPGERNSQNLVDTLEELLATIDRCCKPVIGEEPEKEVSLELKRLWETNESTDFLVIADSKQFPVHKQQLASQSPVFEAMFHSDMKERLTNMTSISDFSSYAVEEFLRFFYTGEIQDESNVMELFSLASMYDVSRLRSICEEMILENLDGDNAYEVFCLGQLHSSKDLKEFAFLEIKCKFPGKHIDDILMGSPEKMIKFIQAAQERDEKLKLAEEAFDEVLLKIYDAEASCDILMK